MALAISKKIVEIPGKKIWENSQFGMQAHFILQLMANFSIFANPESNSTYFMNPIDILPTEDTIGDILLTTEVLREGEIINDIKVVRVDQFYFLKVSRSIKDFWIAIVQLPKNN